MKNRYFLTTLGLSFSRRRPLTACSGLTVYLCLAGPLAAQTWNGTTDALWATTTNWSPATVPGTGNTAFFNNAGGADDTINLGSGVTINTILFSTPGAAAYTLGAGAVNSQSLILNNGGAITMGGTLANHQLFNAAITLGTDTTGQTYTLTNNSAPSILTFAGTVGGTTAGGTAGTKTLAIGGTGAVTLSGNLSVTGASNMTVTSGNTSTVTLGGTNTLKTLNVNGGAASVIDLGSGTTTLANAGADSIKSTTGGTITGGTIILGSVNTATDGLDHGTASGTTLTINSKISGIAANLFEAYYGTGGGLVVLGNPLNDFLGNVSLIQGVVSVATIGNPGSASNLGAGNLISLNGGTLRYTGTGNTTTRTVNLAGSGTIEASGGGLLKFSSAFTADGANSKTLTLGGTGTGEVAAAIVNNSGTNTTSLSKTGIGTWTLSGSPTFTGTANISSGILKLDYTNNTSKLSDTAALTLGAGTIELAGGSHPEVVLSTTLAGAGTITGSPASYLALNTITPGSGSLNLTADDLATTDNLNTNGILGYWATVGSGWAANSGVADVTATGSYIRGITYGAEVTRQSSGVKSIADLSTHVRIIEGSGGSPADITLDASTTTTTITSLVQSAEGGTAAVDATGKTLATQAVLVTSGAGSLTIGTAPDPGGLTAGTAGGTLSLNNASTANNLIVNSLIANNTSASPLVKLGAGTVELNGTNTYTGLSTLGSGTVKLGNDAGLGASGAGNESLIVSGATLDLNGKTIAESFLGVGNGGVQGTGVGDLGAIINSDTVNAATISGTITQGGAGTRNFTIGGPGNITANLITGATGGFTVTKEGTGQLTLAGTVDNAYLALVANAGTTVLGKDPSTGTVHAAGSGFRTEGSAIVQLAGLGNDQIYDPIDVNLNGSSILDMNGKSETIDELVGPTTGAKVYNTANGTTSVLTVGASNGSNTFNGIISDNAGGGQTGIMALTRTGFGGTQTLTNNNTYTGDTRLDGGGGGITLNFAATGIGTDDNLISPLSALIMNNTSGSRTQTLRITGDVGVTNNQTFNGTSVTSSGFRHQIAVTSGTGGTTNLTMGTFSLTSGAYVDFLLPASGSIFASNPDTVLGTRATVNNGASYAQILGGQIVGFNGDLVYVTATNISALPGYAATSNLRVDGTSTGNVIQAAGATQLNTIQFTDTAARTLTLGTGNTLQLGAPGGILRSATAGSVTIGEAGNSGELTSGTASGDDLVLSNGNTTGNLTIYSLIKNNTGGALDLFANGGGTTILAAPNTYTGTTTVQNGALRATHSEALGTIAGGVSMLEGAAVELAGGITIGDEALTIIGSGVGNNGALRNVSGINTWQGLVSMTTAAEIQADTGSTLIFDRAGTNPSLASNNSSITFDAVGTGIITFNDAVNITSSSNPGSFKGGTGTLNLNAANNWAGTGAFRLDDGVVVISNGAALGGNTGGTTVTDNAALHLTGGITTNENITTDSSSGIGNAGAIRSISGANILSGTVTIDNNTGRIGADSGASLAFTNGTTALQTETGGSRSAVFVGAGDFTIGGGGAKNSGSNVLSITKENAGLLTLSSTNTYTGATTVSLGTLRLDYGTSNTSKLADTSGALVLNGGTVELFGATGSHVEIVPSTTLSAGSASTVKRNGLNTAVLAMNTITPGAGSSVHFAAPSIATTDNTNTNGILGGWATITSAGATEWAVNSTNGADGPITAFAGTYTDISRYLDGPPAGIVPDVATNNVRIINGGTTGNITLASTATEINTLRMDASDGPATITMPASTLMIGGEKGGGIIQTTTSGALTLGETLGEGILTTGGTANTGPVTLGLINDSTTNDLTINSVIANNGTDVVGLATDGVGRIVLSGIPTFTGSVAINAGTLHVGELTGLTTNGTLGAATVITNHGSLVFRRTNNTSTDVAGAINGSGSVTYNGPGGSDKAQYAVNSASTYTGPTTIGVARAAVSNAAGLGTGPVTVQDGGQAYVTAPLANNFTISGSGWLEGSGSLGAFRINNGQAINGSVTLAANSRITADSGTATVNGAISGNFNLEIGAGSTNANGIIRLNGNNSYTGTTTVLAAGDADVPGLIVGHNNALGTSAGGTIFNGATAGSGEGAKLELVGGITVTDETLTLIAASGKRASLVLSTANASATWDGNIIVQDVGMKALWSNATGSVLTIGLSSADTITSVANQGVSLRGLSTAANVVNSTIALGSGGLTKTDDGTWMIASTANTYTGQTTINYGILSFGTIADSGVDSSIGAGTSIVLGQNSAGVVGVGTLQFTGASGGASNRTINISNGALGGAGVIENTVAGQTLTLSGNITTSAPTIASALTVKGAGNTTLSGNVTGSPLMSLTKSGTGTLTLSGANTYTGDTTVNAGGTLVVDGDSIANVGKLLINGSGKVEITETTGTVEETVSSLWIDGVEMAAGTYGATGSGATNIDNTHFAGAGVVRVSAGYDSWVSDFTWPSGADKTRTGDPDTDGFTNHQEFLFGTNPTTSNGSLTSTERSGSILTIRWKQRTSGATYQLLESTTLANPWSLSGVTPSNDGPASGDYQPRKADVTIGAGKKFYRVEGVEN